MNKPTEAQIKEFWERYGFKWEEDAIWWAYPDGSYCINLPRLDLNNLFKYAMPLAIERLADIDLSTTYEARCKLLMLWAEKGLTALALFWTLWQVKGS